MLPELLPEIEKFNKSKMFVFRHELCFKGSHLNRLGVAVPVAAFLRVDRMSAEVGHSNVYGLWQQSGDLRSVLLRHAIQSSKHMECIRSYLQALIA